MKSFMTKFSPFFFSCFQDTTICNRHMKARNLEKKKEKNHLHTSVFFSTIGMNDLNNCSQSGGIINPNPPGYPLKGDLTNEIHV